MTANGVVMGVAVLVEDEVGCSAGIHDNGNVYK